MRGGRVLVAGASGRVGGAAVRHLVEAGFEARALVRSPEKGEKARAVGAEPVVGDVTRPETLAPALEGCEGVFSALATATEKEAVEVEYRGNVNLLSAAREAGVSRLSTTRRSSRTTRSRGTSGRSGRRRASRRRFSPSAPSPRRSCGRSCSWRRC